MAYLYIEATPNRKWKFSRMRRDLDIMYGLTSLKNVGYSISGPHYGASFNTLILNITFAIDEDKEVFASSSLYQAARADLQKICKRDKLTILENNSSPLAEYLYIMEPRS